MQELCTNNDEFPRLQPYEISGLLLKEFKERKTSGKIFQNIGVQLEQNIISKRLSLKQETKRMSINFGSGFGNLEAMWCLHNAITELVVKYRSQKLLNFKNVLHSYGSLCNMCMKSDKLNNDDYRILRNLCNETVERTLKLTSGRYGFSKKLHYILHYPEIAKNFHDQLKNIATSRFESKHQCIKKYFTSSNNKMFPAKTIIKKCIMRTKLSSMLIGN
uniref:Uncharacterized protein n=1 Tax=Strongyloides papillosus TaxID=174720 RepID=A0A0N5BUS7_STREA